MDTRNQYQIPQRNELDHDRFAERTPRSPEFDAINRDIAASYEQPTPVERTDYTSMGRSALDISRTQTETVPASAETLNPAYVIGQIGMELTTLRQNELASRNRDDFGLAA
ncbi:MAG TPA: hypothetical protein VL362_01540 [Patescibacteria group bacterium]|jgi:hypothetical protein|nr:hypothetical protein [Patescibacteria group bacterium]